MKRLIWNGALALAMGVASFGCGGSVASEAPSVNAQSAATRAPVAQNAHGPVKLLGEALGDVPLRPEQRAEIEKLAADAEARHAGMKDARKDITETVAAQIQKGAIDRTVLTPKIDAAAAAWESTRPADRAALERLHALLDASQRSQLVDTLEARIHAKMEEHGGGHARMEEWARDLKLTDDQRARIKTALMSQLAAHRGEGHEAWKEGHAKGKKVFEAFRAEKFSLDEVAPAVDARAKASEVSGRFLTIVETVLPVLTPEQRTLAAAKLRARSAEGEELAP